jgi:hypothetical protein
VVNIKKYEFEFDIKNLHKAIGLCGKEALRITAKFYDWKSLEKLETCEDCTVGKVKKKNTNKQWLQGIENTVERLFIGILSIKGESFGGSKFLALIESPFPNRMIPY